MPAVMVSILKEIFLVIVFGFLGFVFAKLMNWFIYRVWINIKWPKIRKPKAA